jgi:hypothetical protein
MVRRGRSTRPAMNQDASATASTESAVAQTTTSSASSTSARSPAVNIATTKIPSRDAPRMTGTASTFAWPAGVETSSIRESVSASHDRRSSGSSPKR